MRRMFSGRVAKFALMLLCVGALFGVTQHSIAQVRSSTNFGIERDSINSFGGLSTSTNFSLESTGGEVATGYASSTNYRLHAGYQQVSEAFLTLSPATDVTMSPALGGVAGGTSNGSTSVVVTTDAPAGYQLFVRAANTPALQNGSESIADYTPAGVVPDATFTTASTDEHFGFSVEGTDAAADFTINAGVCGSGSNVAGSCWDGLSTIDRLVAEGGSNYPVGATTTLNFRVGIGSATSVVPGTYVATTTVTAVAL
jgi:hypothetical protein